NPATIGDALVCHGEFLIKALLVRGLERIFSFFPSLSAIPRELIQHSDFRVLRRSAGGQRDVLRQMALAMTGAQDSSVPAQVYRPRQEALPSRRENMTRLTTLCQRRIV